VSISLVGTPQAGAAINGADVTLTFSTTPAQGDVVVVWGGHFNRAGSSVGPSTSGYTSLINDVATLPFFSIAYKVMGVSPDATVVCRGSGNVADAAAYGCYVLRGVELAAVLDTSVVAAGPTASTNPNAATVTTTTPLAWVLALALSANSDATPGTITSFVNHVQAAGSDTNSAAVAGATLEQSTPGSRNPAAWSSWSTGMWKTATMAIRVLATITPPTGALNIAGIVGALASTTIEIIPVLRTNNKRAGINLIVDQATGQVLGIRTFNLDSIERRMEVKDAVRGQVEAVGLRVDPTESVFTVALDVTALTMHIS